MREWLKDIRKNKGIEVETISIECGISQSYYSLIETGKRNPSVILAQRIGNLLDFEWTRFYNKPDSLKVL